MKYFKEHYHDHRVFLVLTKNISLEDNYSLKPQDADVLI